MKLAQDYLKATASGEMRGGFNARLQGQSFNRCMDGILSGNRWAERNRGWELADSMIRKGKIFSEIQTDKERVEFKCFPDGNEWCCVAPEFVDITESDCYAFSDTRDEAIVEFLANVANHQAKRSDEDE